ncbi:hypothetical protein GOV07_01520 [Candidatus Woesearchaeota archaeon]|nr:hypothetical protein [Candidatus Woesearchaeota archaeon]
MKLTAKQKGNIKNPVFIEGLPGLGNVGKIVVDLLVDQLKAKKLMSWPVDEKPGLVLVQQDNTVRFPELRLYHLKHKKKDFLFLAGEGQPGNEGAAHEFATTVLSELESLGCKEIITIGGIGLQQVPQEPNVYVTGSDKELMKKFAKLGADPKIHGVVGPIIGLTGIMLGLSKDCIPAIALLAESLAHPMYLGLRGAERVLALLSKAYGFKLALKELKESITRLEEATGQAPAGDLPKKVTNYIG